MLIGGRNRYEGGEDVSEAPSANGSNGRNGFGQFAKGNPGGPGNPHAKRVAALRAAVFRAVAESDVEDIVSGLAAAAKKGDIGAAKLVLAYAIGAPQSFIDSETSTGNDVLGALTEVPTADLVDFLKSRQWSAGAR
jgi:hypothetical protein